MADAAQGPVLPRTAQPGPQQRRQPSEGLGVGPAPWVVAWGAVGVHRGGVWGDNSCSKARRAIWGREGLSGPVPDPLPPPALVRAPTIRRLPPLGTSHLEWGIFLYPWPSPLFTSAHTPRCVFFTADPVSDPVRFYPVPLPAGSHLTPAYHPLTTTGTLGKELAALEDQPSSSTGVGSKVPAMPADPLDRIRAFCHVVVGQLNEPVFPRGLSGTEVEICTVGPVCRYGPLSIIVPVELNVSCCFQSALHPKRLAGPR